MLEIYLFKNNTCKIILKIKIHFKTNFNDFKPFMKVEDILNHVILGILYIQYGLFSSQVYRGFKIIHYLYR